MTGRMLHNFTFVALVIVTMIAASPCLAQKPDVAIVAAASAFGPLDRHFTEPQLNLESLLRFGRVDIIDAYAATPTLEQLHQYDAILVWSDPDFFDADAFGNVLADYVDSGGGVVVAVFANTTTNSNRAIGGRWSPRYDVIVPRRGQQILHERTLGEVLLPEHPLMRGVTSFDGGTSSFRPKTNTPLRQGATLVAKWSDGAPLIALGPLPGRVDLGFYPPSSLVDDGYWLYGTDGDIMMANALQYVVHTAVGYLLSVEGACPGDVTVSWSDAEPGLQQGLVFAPRVGTTRIPTGACAGTVLSLDGALHVARTLNTGSGSGSIRGTVGTNACGGYVQFITRSSCITSNPGQIPE